MNNKRLVSPYFLHEIDDIVVVSNRKPTQEEEREQSYLPEKISWHCLNEPKEAGFPLFSA